MKLKKGDTVEVLSGNDKGVTGEILEKLEKLEELLLQNIQLIQVKLQ